MKNETNANANSTSGLAAKVASYKLIARNSLRMGLIINRQSRIGRLEENLSSLAERTKKLEHSVTVENYEISALDANHPNYADTKTAKEERVKALTESLANVAKEVEEVNKQVTEQNEAVAKIESGETKVSLDELNCLVDEMVRQDALNGVATVS